MKKLSGLLILLLIINACSQSDQTTKPQDIWNGYEIYKSGEVYNTLWAGQNINIGTVTYGVEDGDFYVNYDMTASGWTMSLSHMYCGEKKGLPRNKPGKPKIGKFPYSTNHNPQVSVFTYYVPLSELPPANDPGFVVACHADVHGPNGESETAWAEGEFTFSDKGWGWFDTYFYNQPENPFTLIYGTEYTNDSLKVYVIDITNNTTELILSEHIGNNDGSYDGVAYDDVDDILYFVDYNANELLTNALSEENSNTSAVGTLNGDAKSADYFNEKYYYIDESANTIREVSFGAIGNIASDDIISTMPNSLVVTDIAMDPSGDLMYIVGNVGDGTTEMVKWDMPGDTYYTISLSLNEDIQIAYASDGILYAIEPSGSGIGSSTYTIDTDTGYAIEINEDDVIVVDPFSDITKGPVF